MARRPSPFRRRAAIASVSRSFGGRPSRFAKHVEAIVMEPTGKSVCSVREVEFVERPTLEWCRGAELNCLRRPFQGRALPVSYLGTRTTKILRKTGRAAKRKADRKERPIRQSGEATGDFALTLLPNRQCIDWSNSRIQSFFLRTSRGLEPSAGPTIPSFSMRSIRRAARP